MKNGLGVLLYKDEFLGIVILFLDNVFIIDSFRVMCELGVKMMFLEGVFELCDNLVISFSGIFRVSLGFSYFLEDLCILFGGFEEDIDFFLRFL